MTRAVGAVFGALVIATFAAFFVAQRLKNTPSVIQQLRLNTYGPGYVFSPNGDGRRDHVRISLMLKKADRVTLTIIDTEGDPVRTLVDDRPLRAYQRLGLPGVLWDGRGDDGRLVPDGRYKLRITLREQGRSVIYPTSILKDTTPPRPVITSIGPERGYGPEIFPEPHGGDAVAHFGPALASPVIHVFRTGPGRVRQVVTAPMSPGATSWRWDGRTAAGRKVSPGTYLLVPEWRDAAGNIGTSVPLGRDGLPVLGPGRLPGRGGITVRYLGARTPIMPVQAGRPVQFGVDSWGRWSWDVRRLGAPSPRKRGGPKTKPTLTTTAPTGASGVYLFEVHNRSHAVQVPFAVQAARSVAGTATKPHGVLVLLPLMTWQGRNAVDDDGDGKPDVLDLGGPSKLYRDFAGNGLPVGFAQHEAPALVWLERTHRRYDVTTDAALLARRGPALAGHHGVLIPGDARWLPSKVRASLRAFVRGGGTVVSLGTDSLRRTVQLDHTGRLAQPSPPRPADLFGERIGPVVTKTTNLDVFQDDPSVKLFLGSAGVFDDVTSWEPTLSTGHEADLLSSAVTVDPQGRTVVAAARFGKGLVIRPGFPDFASRLSSNDPAISALMARMWALLSH